MRSVSTPYAAYLQLRLDRSETLLRRVPIGNRRSLLPGSDLGLGRSCDRITRAGMKYTDGMVDCSWVQHRWYWEYNGREELDLE